MEAIQRWSSDLGFERGICHSLSFPTLPSPPCGEAAGWVVAGENVRETNC